MQEVATFSFPHWLHVFRGSPPPPWRSCVIGMQQACGVEGGKSAKYSITATKKSFRAKQRSPRCRLRYSTMITCALMSETFRKWLTTRLCHFWWRWRGRYMDSFWSMPSVPPIPLLYSAATVGLSTVISLDFTFFAWSGLVRRCRYAGLLSIQEVKYKWRPFVDTSCGVFRLSRGGTTAAHHVPTLQGRWLYTHVLLARLQHDTEAFTFTLGDPVTFFQNGARSVSRGMFARQL